MERRWLVDLGDVEEVTVAVERGDGLAPGERRVRVGDLVAIAAPLADGGWLLRLPDGRVQRLDVDCKRTGQLTVMHRARPYEITVRSELDALLGVGRHGHGGSGNLRASMPGKVVKLLVGEGDAVEEGAGVLILEAMKMENVVKAPLKGVVVRVHVAEGASVEADAPLLDIAQEGPAAG